MAITHKYVGSVTRVILFQGMTLQLDRVVQKMKSKTRHLTSQNSLAPQTRPHSSSRIKEASRFCQHKLQTCAAADLQKISASFHFTSCSYFQICLMKCYTLYFNEMQKSSSGGENLSGTFTGCNQCDILIYFAA